MGQFTVQDQNRQALIQIRINSGNCSFLLHKINIFLVFHRRSRLRNRKQRRKKSERMHGVEQSKGQDLHRARFLAKGKI